MNKQDLVAYLLNFMTSAVPISAHSSEEPPDVLARYQHLAETVSDVTLDEAPLFKGEHGHVMTALLVASVIRFESTFVKGPIHGDCIGTKDGMCRKATDRPRSFCYMQIQPGPFGLTLTDETYTRGTKEEPGNITGTDLDADDALCVRLGIHMLRESLRGTGDLGIYTGEGKGGRKAKHRFDLARFWFLKHPMESGGTL